MEVRGMSIYIVSRSRYITGEDQQRLQPAAAYRKQLDQLLKAPSHLLRRQVNTAETFSTPSSPAASRLGLSCMAKAGSVRINRSAMITISSCMLCTSAAWVRHLNVGGLKPLGHKLLRMATNGSIRLCAQVTVLAGYTSSVRNVCMQTVAKVPAQAFRWTHCVNMQVHRGNASSSRATGYPRYPRCPVSRTLAKGAEGKECLACKCTGTAGTVAGSCICTCAQAGRTGLWLHKSAALRGGRGKRKGRLGAPQYTMAMGLGCASCSGRALPMTCQPQGPQPELACACKLGSAARVAQHSLVSLAASRPVSVVRLFRISMGCIPAELYSSAVQPMG